MVNVKNQLMYSFQCKLDLLTFTPYLFIDLPKQKKCYFETIDRNEKKNAILLKQGLINSPTTLVRKRSQRITKI